MEHCLEMIALHSKFHHRFSCDLNCSEVEGQLPANRAMCLGNSNLK